MYASARSIQGLVPNQTKRSVTVQLRFPQIPVTEYKMAVHDLFNSVYDEVRKLGISYQIQETEASVTIKITSDSNFKQESRETFCFRSSRSLLGQAIQIGDPHRSLMKLGTNLALHFQTWNSSELLQLHLPRALLILHHQPGHQCLHLHVQSRDQGMLLLQISLLFINQLQVLLSTPSE